MKMPAVLKRMLPRCPAEELLEQNAAFSKTISMTLGDTLDAVTQVFDRRNGPTAVLPIVERRKARR